MLMQIAQSPGTIEKLGQLFGNAAQDTEPVTPQHLNGPLPAVDLGLLETIEDNTTFRDEESEAWFHLLQVVGRTDSRQLKSASLGEIAYAQLLNQPKFYRGQVVRIDGNARRVEAITPAANNAGVDQLFRIIIQPGRDLLRPYTLYCVDLPADWTVGEQPPNDGRLTAEGLFFKNWVYNNDLGVDLSPVFVSRSFSPIAVADTLVDRTPASPLGK